MRRPALFAALFLGCLLPAMTLLPAVTLAAGNEAGPTLVLPLRTVGISETTAVVVRDLLIGELEARGFPTVRPSAGAIPLPAGAAACADEECAGRLAGEQNAVRVVYGSLSRLGGKVLVRMSALRAGEGGAYYTDQFSASSEDDLDTVMRRVAEAIVSGRADSDRATVESITAGEAADSRRRSTRTGLGVRTGFLYPSGGSYAGKDRLTNFRVIYKFEGTSFLVETTPVLGWSATNDAIDWTLLDIFGARIFGLGDVASYAGAGLGLHRVTLEKEVLDENPYYPGWIENRDQTATTLAVDAGGGLLLFRTYNFQLVADVRYHVVFDSFTRLGGDGAHGVLVSFGISR